MKKPHHIHLIARGQRNLHRLDGSSEDWESGNWSVPADRDWSGVYIFLHERRAEAPYQAGVIQSARTIPTGERDEGRVVFRFRAVHRVGADGGNDCAPRWARERGDCG